MFSSTYRTIFVLTPLKIQRILVENWTDFDMIAGMHVRVDRLSAQLLLWIMHHVEDVLSCTLNEALGIDFEKCTAHVFNVVLNWRKICVFLWRLSVDGWLRKRRFGWRDFSLLDWMKCARVTATRRTFIGTKLTISFHKLIQVSKLKVKQIRLVDSGNDLRNYIAMRKNRVRTCAYVCWRNNK